MRGEDPKGWQFRGYIGGNLGRGRLNRKSINSEEFKKLTILVGYLEIGVLEIGNKNAD